MKVSDAKTEILIMAKYRRFSVQLNRDLLYYHHKKLISKQIGKVISILVTDVGDNRKMFQSHLSARSLVVQMPFTLSRTGSKGHMVPYHDVANINVTTHRTQNCHQYILWQDSCLQHLSPKFMYPLQTVPFRQFHSRKYFNNWIIILQFSFNQLINKIEFISNKELNWFISISLI